MRSGKSLLALVVVFGALVGYLYFVDAERPLTESEQRDKVFTVEAGKVQELRVRGSAGETATLRREGDAWQMTEPVAGRADDSEVSSITSNLESLEIQAVVDEEPGDLQPFGLQEPRVEIAFKAEGDADYRRLLLGGKTPTGGDIYARRDGEPQVFLVPAYLESTFDKAPFDLRDKTIVRFERDQVDRVEIAHGKERVELAKSGDQWRMVAPVQARADFSAVEGLITRIQSAQMRSVAAEGDADLKAYGLGAPAATLTLGAGSARTVVQFGRATSGEEGDGDVFARDASDTRVVTVGSDLLDEVRKSAADFRRKELFEFRPYTARRIELVRGSDTFAFEKRKGEGENDAETWHRVSPAAGDVETTKVETLLSRVSNLRAQSFAGTPPAASKSPELVATVQFDDDRTEQVRFARSGGNVFAVREDEPGAAQVEAAPFDDALKALDDLQH